eukprot:6240582-Prymnesium_polylepis.1
MGGACSLCRVIHACINQPSETEAVPRISDATRQWKRAAVLPHEADTRLHRSMSGWVVPVKVSCSSWGFGWTVLCYTNGHFRRIAPEMAPSRTVHRYR